MSKQTIESSITALDAEIKQKSQELKRLLRTSKIAERKHAELLTDLTKQRKALKSSNEWAHALIASVDEGIFCVDTEGVVNFINGVALELLGYAENELLGKKVHSIIHHSYTDGSSYPVSECPMFHAFDSGKASHIEDEVLWRKDDTCFAAEYKARPLFQDKVITGAVITFNDITERIEAEHRLINEIADRQQSEVIASLAKNRLEHITDNIPGAVYQLEVIGGEIGITFMSYGIELLHRLNRQDLLAGNGFSFFIDSIYHEDREHFMQTLQEALSTLTLFSCEYRVAARSHDEEVKWIHAEAVLTKVDDDDDDDIMFFGDEDEDESSDYNIILNGNLVDISKAKVAHQFLLKQQQEIVEIHQHTRDSIQYASLIQGALIPDNNVFREYFKDFFVIWQPKDIVGGDIYLIEQLNEDEVIMMVIDCTGHGVPGAFVTMLVKAIERQLMSYMGKDSAEVSPAKLLALFNGSIKHLLRQNDKDSISNAGFDGGILYYNKRDQVIKFAGANTPLFFVQHDELKVFKGNRHSIGYKKSDADYVFTDYEIDASIPTKLYLTTDGYLDQNGGEKGFPFSKKRFMNIINNYHKESFADQQEIFMYSLASYQQDYERNDDITLIGFEV